MKKLLTSIVCRFRFGNLAEQGERPVRGEYRL